ncbi:hypothetical protein KBC54_01590, partial [Patescibacteria group bacterium]|nr:hypothetical protein [Patescibacteria group bacterium]
MLLSVELPLFRMMKKIVSRILPITILFSALAFLVFAAVDRIHPPSIVKADITTVTWDGDASDGLWSSATNWSDDAVPDENKNVVVDLDAGVTVTASGSIVFNNLTLGGTASASNTLVLTGSTSGTNITIDNNGTLQQNSSSTNTIVGALTVKSGGLLTHTANTTAHDYSVNFLAANIDVQLGGIVNVDGKGYRGGNSAWDWNGSGPGGGRGANQYGASGGAHAGNGGAGTSWPLTDAYCDAANPMTLGSGGGVDGGGETGGNGGGLIVLHTQSGGSLTINGVISANGRASGSTDVNSSYNGGGAGGGINLSAGTLTGTPAQVTAKGGTGSNVSGGGGGGCIALLYTSSNTIDLSGVYTYGGSAGYQRGGAGEVFVQDTDSGVDGNLYVYGSGVSDAATSLVSSLSLNVLYTTGTTVLVPTAKTLTISAPVPFVSDGANPSTITTNGTLNLSGTSTIYDIHVNISNGTFQNNATLNVAPTGALTLGAGAALGSTITDFTTSGTTNLYQGIESYFSQSAIVTIGAATTTFYNYSTTTRFTVGNFVIRNQAVVTHGSNSTEQTHIVHIDANAIDIQNGGSINVDGRGYRGGEGGVDWSGSGPGRGRGANQSGASGGAHAGNGGAGTSWPATDAYCDTNNPDTLGSGGGSDGYGNPGGYGGGLVMIHATTTLVVDGSLMARGKVSGTTDTNSTYNGGGAGGAFNIVAGAISGTPDAFTVNGGAGGATSGGGGGGCVKITYASMSASVSSTLTLAGGVGGFASGGDGVYVEVLSNSAPTASSYIGPIQSSASLVTATSTIADADSNATILGVEYSTDNSTWVNATVATASENSEGNGVTTSSGRISGIDTDNDGSIDLTFAWDAATDLPNTEDSSVYLRITPNDGTASGTTRTSDAFNLDTKSPVAPGDLAISTTSTQSVTFTFGSAATDDNFKEYAIYYKAGASGVAVSDSSFTSSTDADLGAIDFNSTATTQLSGLATSTQYVANIWAYDDIGHLTPAASEIAFYTLADAPGTPTVTASSSATILHLTIDKASNPNTSA